MQRLGAILAIGILFVRNMVPEKPALAAHARLFYACGTGVAIAAPWAFGKLIQRTRTAT